jgi:ATP-dependent Clp protease ATP-binding subunit ClpB
MNLGNYTVKAAEAVQQAQQLAFNNKNANIETEHILMALLEQEDSPVEYLLKKNAIPVTQLIIQLNAHINKLPKTENGEPAQMLSRESNNVMLRAGAVLKKFGDEFVTPRTFVTCCAAGK